MRAMQRSLLVVVLAACGGGGGGAPDAAVDAAPDGPAGCARAAAAADRTRFVVVSHPYEAGGVRPPVFEVLELSPAGALTRPSPERRFSLGKAATFGTVAFTPDGEVGLVALEDGTLGVFHLDAAGTPSVVHASLAGSFYASSVVMDPRGDRAWILEGNTRDNGGGVFLVTIGCDGTLTDHGLIAPAHLPRGLAFAGDRAVIAARDILDAATPGHDVQLLRWGDAPQPLAGADAFGDDDAIVGGAALTSDGATYLVGDTSGFSGVPNRVAVVGVTDAALTPIGVISPLEDPQAIATSPFGDVAVVTSAFGDAIFILDTGGANGAWQLRGEVPYMGAAPQLPGDLAPIGRGALRGHVLVAENVAIRHLAFRDTGAVEDLGSLQLGSGLANINGVIGVTP